MPDPSSLTSLKPKFRRDVLWNMGSLGVLGLTGIVINAVVIAWRGSETLGVFNQVFAAYIILSQMSVGGVHASVLRHVALHQTDRRRCAQITTAGLLLVTVLSLLVSALALASRDALGRLLDSPDVATGLAYAVPGLVFFSLNKVLRSALNGLRAMRAVAVFEAGRYGLLLASVLLILSLDWPSSRLPAALTLAEGVLFVAMIGYVATRQFRLQLGPEPMTRLVEHLSFGFRGGLAGILSAMNTRVDVLLLGGFCDDATVGLYSFAAILAEGLGQIPSVVRRNLDPILGACFARDERERIRAMAQQIRRVFYPIMGAIGVAVVLGYPLMATLLASDLSVPVSWAVFAILVAGIVASSGYRPFFGILLQAGRPGTHTLFIACMVASNIVLNLVFISLLSVHGAAAATALVFVLEAVCMVLLARRLLGVRL